MTYVTDDRAPGNVPKSGYSLILRDLSGYAEVYLIT